MPDQTKFPYRISWRRDRCDIIPTIEGQSETLPDGTVKAWYTKEQLERVIQYATGVAMEPDLLPAPE